MVIERFGLSLDIQLGTLDNITRKGPLILIANHPYGILDGLMMCYILSVTRGDFKIFANQIFYKARDLNKIIIPISFNETKDAIQTNVRSRRLALNYLSDGGAIGIFPGGTVSTAMTPFSQPMDPSWRSFTARMITKSNATVVPIHFEGQASRLFQIASHVHPTLRMGLLINEFKKRVDGPVGISIGNPIDPAEISKRSKNSKHLMQFLRRKTYELSQKSIDPSVYGFEFEGRKKRPNTGLLKLMQTKGKVINSTPNT